MTDTPQALIDAAERDAYQRFRQIDEYNTAASAEVKQLQARIELLQQEHQRANAEWVQWELANRARIDALKDTLGEGS